MKHGQIRLNLSGFLQSGKVPPYWMKHSPTIMTRWWLSRMDGIVFSSNQPDWILKLTHTLTPEQQAKLKENRQLGKLIADPANYKYLPFKLQGDYLTFRDKTYATHSVPLDWPDIQGQWRLVVLKIPALGCQYGNNPLWSALFCWRCLAFIWLPVYVTGLNKLRWRPSMHNKSSSELNSI